MRHITPTETKSAASDAALAQSALQLTRAAIARWSGNPMPAGALARDLPRVSPQARWVADAQDGLADWIARGGFAQAEDSAPAPLAKPVMYRQSAGACID